MEPLRTLNESRQYLNDFFRNHSSECPLIVCGNSWKKMPLNEELVRLAGSSGIKLSYFSDFEPNPQYRSVIKGVNTFQKFHCDCIIAAGGGSAIDVAKCIKLYCEADLEEASRDGSCLLKKRAVPNDIPFLAIPTTAGTGSEATTFAVIYYEHNKQSVDESSLLPTDILLCPELLEGLPIYQRKSTMLDVLCHAVESFWSVHSTEESRKLSLEALDLFRLHRRDYLKGTGSGNAGMMYAANVAGQAINITRTTAAHAMCYKLTTLYGLPHGYAAALCLPHVWRFMTQHMEAVSDPRGREYLSGVFQQLAVLLTGKGEAEIEDGITSVENLLSELELETPVPDAEEELYVLAGSVNAQRLGNNPVALSKKDLENIYRNILHI